MVKGLSLTAAGHPLNGCPPSISVGMKPSSHSRCPVLRCRGGLLKPTLLLALTILLNTKATASSAGRKVTRCYDGAGPCWYWCSAAFCALASRRPPGHIIRSPAQAAALRGLGPGSGFSA
jgi:hypothetical protein